MTKNLAEEMQRTARQALAGLQPSPQGEEAGGLPARRLLAAFFRARYLVFGTTLFGILIGTFMAITTPNNYVSTGKFLFTSSGAESRVLDPTQAKETSQETIATGAAYILNSDDLLTRVIKRLGPARILAPYQPGDQGASGARALFLSIQRDWNATKEEEQTEEEALKRLQKTIFVERPRFTDVLIATCNANNAELAQEVLATYMDEAVKWHIEKYDDQKAYDDAKRTYEDSIEALDKAQRAMREFLERQANTAQFDETKRRIQLDEIQAQSRVSSLEEDLLIKSSLLEQIDKRLADPNVLPPTVVRKVRQSVSTEELAELRTRLADTRILLREKKNLLNNQQDPDIVALERKIEFIRQAIEDVTKGSKDAELVETVEDNKLYLAAREEHDKLQRELWSLDAQVKQARALHKEKHDELKRMLELEPQYETLRNAHVIAEENKSASQLNWNAAQQKRALGLGNYSSLKPIQEASLPLEKEGPNRGKLLIGGFFVGLFLGLGIVVLRALPDSVVRTRDDLESIEGLAVIGVMPRLDRVNLRRHLSLRERGW